MKLSEVKPYFESSNDMQEHFFSIEDQGMIFDILRSKMYSNPILAICREISSNARDAHREVNKQDIPVHIHLPTGLEPEYKIKDFGPGISPDRMVNIFIKYTASTKRGDNVQTGGFGLGAKTPFAYSDQFTVTTVHNGIKYSYVCSIDETKVGKLSLLDKRPSDENNSTEIAIPIKHQDFNLFRQYTEQSCRHWDVKPIITGGNIEWSSFSKVLEGNGWAIAKTTDWQRHAKLVIDGIEYPLELDSLRKYADTKIIDSAQGNFVMYFGVGELSLSANREQIFLDKSTQEKIRKRMEEITAEVKKSVVDKIDAFPNLWEANVFYRRILNQAFHNLAFLGKLTWQGTELNNGYFSPNCPVYTFSKGKYSRKHGNDPDKLTRSLSRNVTFDEFSAIYINDLPIKEPTPRHLKKAFEDSPTLKSVNVICPNAKQTEDDLNKRYNLDKMLPKKLSSITKASSRAYTATTLRLLVFKFDNIASAFRQVSYDSMEEDANEKVLCFLKRDDYGIRFPVLTNNSSLSLGVLKSLLAKNPQTSFYGVDQDTDRKRIDEDFNDFTKLDDFIDSKVLNNKTINYVEIKFAQSHAYDVDERMLKHVSQFESLIDKGSLFMKRLNLHKKIKTLAAGDKSLLEVYESAKGPIEQSVLDKFVKDNPDWNIDKLDEEYDTKYPLIEAINTYNLSPFLEHFAQYVNMIDKI